VSIQPWAMPPVDVTTKVNAIPDRPSIKDDHADTHVDMNETRMNRPLFSNNRDRVVPSPVGIRRRVTVQ
jgi:hypothetical protein